MFLIYIYANKGGRMIIQRKTQIFSALLVTSVFLFQSCATLIRGPSQEIPITSNPTGAKVIVDGKMAGDAPLSLDLKRGKSHIIRIEKQDYNPAVIEISQKSSPALSIIGNLVWGAVGFIAGIFGAAIVTEGFEVDRPVAGLAFILGGHILGWGIPLYIDSSRGTNFTLNPKELNVTLTKIDGAPQPNFIFIDAEKFQAVKWIRIKCGDSDGEDEIVNLDNCD